MTLKEIAQEAGVSMSTVSRVINNKGTNAASQEVRDRIWEIVRRTGYSPNTAARNLKTGQNSEHASPRSRSIACIFARTQEPMKDAFFSTLARGIEQEAFKHNYVVKYIITSLEINNPATFRLVSDNQVDGAAVLGRCDKQMLRFLKKYFNSVVYSGLNEIQANYDQIICDGRQAAVVAVSELQNLGHSKIAYIGETSNEIRFNGYCDAMNAKTLPVLRDYIVNTPMTSGGGYQGAKKLLNKSKDFTAVFCPNDITAIGVMKALQEHGLKIPSDVSIISIDDIDLVQYITPMLTTIHVPITEMGQVAAKILIDRIEGGHHLPMKVNMPFYLAARESTGPSRKKNVLSQV